MEEKGAEACELSPNQLAVQRVYQTKLLQKGKKRKLSKEPPALKRPFSESGGTKKKAGSPFLLDHAGTLILLSAAPGPPIPLSLAPVLSFYSFLFLLIAVSPGHCCRSFMQLPESSKTLLDNERGGKRQKQRKSLKKKKKPQCAGVVSCVGMMC